MDLDDFSIFWRHAMLLISRKHNPNFIWIEKLLAASMNPIESNPSYPFYSSMR
jgi:hypothetical protein